MQQLLNVMTPATSYDFVTLAEMKGMLLIPPTDTSKDVMLGGLITDISETIAKLCNRVFGYETVDETYYQLEDGKSRRLYLSRWPVALADIQTMTQDGADILPNVSDWVLEESTGTLYQRPDLGPWYGVIDVVYSGGYVLPAGCPGPLKFAAMAIIREAYMAFIRNPALFGVRQLAHKASRISYYDPSKMLTMGLPDTWKAVERIAEKYIRHWA